jgi:hypothetical protein
MIEEGHFLPARFLATTALKCHGTKNIFAKNLNFDYPSAVLDPI